MANLDQKILMDLGRLLEGQDRLTKSFEDEKKTAMESRQRLYERTDDLSAEIHVLKQNIAIAGQATAQVREEVKLLKTSLADHKTSIQPSIDDWKRLKALGYGMSGLILLAGLSATTIFTSVLEAVRTAFKNWFG